MDGLQQQPGRRSFQQRNASVNDTSSSAVRVISGGTARRSLRALENTMATLALDTRQPVALELVGDKLGISFQMRASTPGAISHLTSQVQALYPQARMVRLSPCNDPLHLESDEALTVVELTVRGQPYLSLRTPDPRTWHGSGSGQQNVVGDDPLLAVVGALESLPEGMRAIVQLALLPASPRWARPHLRKAVEHPLEPERERDRRQQTASRNGNGPSMGLMFALGMVVVFALFWRRFGTQLLPLVPAWIGRDIPLALRGQLPAFTAPQVLQLIVVVMLVFACIFLISRLWQRIRGSTPLYDSRAVGEKTKRVVYRARLRLLVIGKVEPWKITWGNRERQKKRGVKHLAHSLWQWVRRRIEERRKRQAVAATLIAAYRLYENPAGNVLVPHVCHLRRAHLIAPSRPRASRVFRHLTRRFRLRTPLPPANGSRRLRFALRCLRMQTMPVLRWLLLGRARWERGVTRSPLYLSIEEVAALWHLIPEQDTPDIAGLERHLARSRPLPPQVINTLPTEILPSQIGECQHAGHVWPVFAPVDLFHQNSLAVAATGKGKSTLFSHLALAHLAGNLREGLFFMEPHGDTVQTLLGSIPVSRREDVTLIDLSDETAVAGLNPLDMTQGRGRDKTVDDILAVFIAFWQKQRSWGPRTENILQFALLALTEANLRRLERDGEEMGAMGQYTLLDVIPLLQKPGFRRMVLDEVRDPVVLDWFHHYYDPLRQSFRDEMISSIINKISKYAAAKVSRRLLGQSRATVRLSDDIRAGRAILINTASGIVGEEVSALVGATLVGLFQAALAEQIRLSTDARRRFWVVIDEFQTYLGIDYHTMLAELRKYGGSFALATQSLAYLDEVDRSLRPTVLANSDHLFCFAMEAADAKQLSPSLDGLEPADLLSLSAYNCYARWTVQGQRLPAFSLQIAPPPRWDAAVATAIRQHSNERHTRPVALVDEEVSPEPSPQPLLDEAFLWHEEQQGQESGEAEETMATTNDLESAQAASTRRRGGRGKGSTQSRTGTASEQGARGTSGSVSQAGDLPLASPYVLNESARARPRTRVWQPEEALGDESGEMRGE